MIEQGHIIKKQIIELQLSSQQGAFEVQSEVSRIYRSKVIPLIEALCNQLSDEQTIVRIDSLEIDLGNININNLEQELVEKIEEYIKQHLPEKKKSSNSHVYSQSTSQLELLIYFLQTGMRPWWAKTLSKQELIDYFDRLITTSPNQIHPILWHSFQDEKQLKRLIYQFPDATLLKIIHLFYPSLIQFIANYNSDIIELCKKIEILRNIPENMARLERWRGIFLSLFFESNIKREKKQIIKESLLYISTSFNLNYLDLVNQIQKIVERFRIEGKSFKSELPKLLSQIVFSSQSEKKVEDQNLIIYSQNFTNYQPSIESFSDSDEIYIQNSGLILLWPFLNRFFEEVGLLQENNFINLSSVERAVLLLQYLADASSAPPEHILPLNKLLCGIELLEPVETNWKITEQERSECENLLCAVIQHWSILKNTSIEGLRKAFLQRKGVLRIIDGSLLLQVERETYDVLLDKIPWSIGIIKFPWMNEALSVEWS